MESAKWKGRGCSITASEKTHWINWFQPGNCPITNTDYRKSQSQRAVLETPTWWKLIRQNHFWYSHWEFWTFSSSKGQASARFVEMSFSLYITLIENQHCNQYHHYRQKKKDVTKISQHTVLKYKFSSVVCSYVLLFFFFLTAISGSGGKSLVYEGHSQTQFLMQNPS